MVKIEIGSTTSGITLQDTNTFEAVEDLMIAAEKAIVRVYELLNDAKAAGTPREVIVDTVEGAILIMLEHLAADGYIRQKGETREQTLS